MGSVYFYLEALLTLHSLLKRQYSNPAILAVEYSLVPDASYPTQLSQILTAYKYALSLISGRAANICVAGDSAGAMLIMSLLLDLSKTENSIQYKPGFAALLSPWVTLLSETNQDTPSDYLNAESLQLYGSQYAGIAENLHDPLVSPGCCKDPAWWVRAAPVNGFYITFGSEEVFGPDIKQLIFRLRSYGISVSVKEEPGGIHAWVIARLYLEESVAERARGMKEFANMVARNINPLNVNG